MKGRRKREKWNGLDILELKQVYPLRNICLQTLSFKLSIFTQYPLKLIRLYLIHLFSRSHQRNVLSAIWKL